MSRTNYLLEQVARAKRFAEAIPSERETFEKLAAKYQSELDDSNAPANEAEPRAQPDAASSDNTAAPSEAGTADAVSSESDSAPTPTDDQPETRD
jgi:hypothetical protein